MHLIAASERKILRCQLTLIFNNSRIFAAEKLRTYTGVP
jgi:hypothetical protein